MCSKGIIVIVFSCSAFSLFSQELYIPRDVQKGYRKGTRSMDGRPGKNYWQNTARYNINLTVMPPDRNIRGSEIISYLNNSNDTLQNLVIRLFLNIHKPGAPRDRGANPDYLTSGMHIDMVKVNGKKVAWNENSYLNTLQSLRLQQALLPKDSVQLSFDWHYEISLQSDREGMIDSSTWYFAYFYPRVAVYDDYAGWDRMEFVEGKEFYSDFNDYTVTINVPKNFLVWGTGTLQQPEKLLQPEYLRRLRESESSDQAIRIVTKEDLARKQVTIQNPVNSWVFSAIKIPDMAFGISDHYNWDGASAVVDDKTGRRASAFAAYDEQSKDFQYMTSFIRHAMQWFSRNLPGVPYPYEKMTVFRGFSDMEYPMMCNNSSETDTSFTKFTAEHEIAHTYMPFYMGINETRYGFMDEGWATAFEYLVGCNDIGNDRSAQLFKLFRIRGWISDPSQSQDLAIITPGNDLTGVALGNNEYGKAAIGYLAMKELLGDDQFKKCLQAYMERWNGKHPTPWDFFYTFNDVSGKNLNWFWSSWFFSNNYIDLSVKTAVKSTSGYTLTLNNIGGMPAPVDVVMEYTDGSEEVFHQSPAIWQKNPKTTTVNIKTAKKVSSISLDGGIFMDADESNNSWKAR
jgi:Peptidase family M1 domain